MRLLVLLLVVLPLMRANNSRYPNCRFETQYADNGRIVPNPSDYKRNWYTIIMGQYSPLTDQLVLLFTTPDWISEVGQFKVMLTGCTQAGGNIKLVNATDRRVVMHPVGTNITILAINMTTSQRTSKLPKEFGLCLQLHSSADGTPIVPRAMSPTAGACHVSMTTDAEEVAGLRKPSPRNMSSSLLGYYLWMNYHLVITESCCLAYKHEEVDNIAMKPRISSAASAELIALWYIGGVCALSAALGSLYCLRGQRSICRPKPALELGNLPLRIRCGANRPLGYQHLLSECKSVRSGLTLALPEYVEIGRLDAVNF